MMVNSIAINNVLFPSSDDEEYDMLPPKRRKVFRVRNNFDLNGWEFKERFRLRTSEVEYLVEKLGAHIAHNTKKNHALSPQHQILLTLHWLGNGSQYHGCSDMHGVTKATVCRTIKRVVTAIVDLMFQEEVRWPTNCDENAAKFMEAGGFPFVAACADGTLVPIDKPHENEEQFVDRKGRHSINSLMVCGPDYKFYFVSARWPGATHDQRVLRNSTLAQNFERGWRPFPGAVVLGDSAYENTDWLITCLNNNPDDPAERRFNRAHKSTRRFIECAYGILKSRFPCLKLLRLQPIYAGKVIMACTVLHNIATVTDNLDCNLQNLDENDVEDENATENNEGRSNPRIQQLLSFFS